EAPDDRRLAACLTTRDGEPEPSASELRRFLRESLPEPMIPSAFVVLAALPLSPNGKVDREALSAVGWARPEPEPEAAFVPPRGPVEEVVAAVWAAVLGRPRVGAHDHFFDLGGHSLLATQVISRLRDAFGAPV